MFPMRLLFIEDLQIQKEGPAVAGPGTLEPELYRGICPPEEWIILKYS